MDYEERTSTHTDLQEIHFHRTLSTSVPPRVTCVISFFLSNVGRASPFIFVAFSSFLAKGGTTKPQNSARNDRHPSRNTREMKRCFKARLFLCRRLSELPETFFFVDEYWEYRVPFIYESSLSETFSDQGSLIWRNFSNYFLLGFSCIGWLEFPCHSPTWEYM